MLLDWTSAQVPLALFAEHDQRALRSRGDRIQRYDIETGEIRWTTQAWDSMRSDSHGVAFHVGSDRLRVQGSPARPIGDGDAVFGAGAARASDVGGCVEAMCALLGPGLGVSLPPVPQWNVTRVDVTQNILLSGLAHVRSALATLRSCECGRYRVDQKAGDTVYWSPRSSLRSGKAYAKGPHLPHLMKQRDYEGRRYSTEEIAMADGLLRLELKLGRHWWRRQTVERPWYAVTGDDLRVAWRSYFERMLGEAEVTEMNVEDRVVAAAATEGQAKAAIGCWALIRAYGWEKAKAMQSRRTQYRNLKVLRAAGLSDADLSVGNADGRQLGGSAREVREESGMTGRQHVGFSLANDRHCHYEFMSHY